MADFRPSCSAPHGAGAKKTTLSSHGSQQAQHDRQRGFTILEIIISLAILAVIVGGAGMAVSSIRQDQELHRPARAIQEHITKTGIQARRAQRPYQLLLNSQGISSRPAPPTSEPAPTQHQPQLSFERLQNVSFRPPGSDQWQLLQQPIQVITLNPIQFSANFAIRTESQLGIVTQEYQSFSGELLEEQSSSN